MEKPFKAIDIAKQLTRKLFTSTNHVFDRYWSGDVAKGAFNTQKTVCFQSNFGLQVV